MYAWDIVNEAFNADGTLRGTLWSDSPGIGRSGTGYIEQAFRWAHEADPKALLFYNDYGAEPVNAKSDAIYKMARDFLSRNVPIAGIGMQMHFTSEADSLASIEANIKRIAELGLQVQITELDVRIPVDSSGGATAVAVSTQSRIYHDAVALCLKFPRCTAVQTWGFTDKYSWIPRAYPGYGAALEFDRAYRPKPAYESIREALISGSVSAAADDPPPVELTAEQDHKRLLDLLHISALRRGADGRNPKAPNAANYDESKANPYPNLPDPLVLRNGAKVTTAAMWWSRRRPEIVEDFDREVYGRVPRNTPPVKWEIVRTARETNNDIPVVTKQLVGHVDNSSYPRIAVDIQMTLTTPANAAGPVPVIMEFGFTGFRLPANALPAPPTGPTWQQQVLAKGWGYAILTPASIQADNGAGLTHGIIGLMNHGQPRKVDDWGALRAWAWGASRALDYFESNPAVDAKRVGIAGHSRYGKAALVAMAYDQRFAIAYVSSSGEGGAKLHRRNWGELVENVAGVGEYHWMAGNFLKYAGPLTWNDLPVDSHELIALCAPRPVFIGAGATNGDGWVDAKGMFLAAVAAGPVYRLLGKRDLGASEFPPIETPLVGGELAFRQHSGGHTPAPNWPVFLEFAARHF